MLESVIPAFEGLVTAAKAMASFDAFRKGRRGDVRALIEEMKENSRLCFRVVVDGVDHRLVIPRFADRKDKRPFRLTATPSRVRRRLWSAVGLTHD